MKNTDTNKVRNLLLKREQLLTDRLNRIKTDLYHQKQAVDPDFEEQAIERENEEVLIALLHEVESELADISFAVKRLENNTYLLCKCCGDAIPSQRLEAIPTASLCIDCSERAALSQVW